MKKFQKKGEKDKPEVNFNPKTGELFLGGSSLPENVLEVYTPILDWLKQYILNPSPNTRFTFSFEYLNTASTNMMARIVELLCKLNDKGNKVQIIWNYMTSDYDMKDLGMELFEGINVKYKLEEQEYES